MENKEGIEEKVEALLEKVKAFCEETFSMLEEGSHKPIEVSEFIRKEVALFALTGKFPKKPEELKESIQKAELLKLLTESEELQITGFNKNQKTGKMTIPTNMMKNLIEKLDEEIWGEKESFWRKYAESEGWNDIEERIKFDKATLKGNFRNSKSSFLSFICFGWLQYLNERNIYHSMFKRLVFLYDLLNAYGIQLIDETYNNGNPTNKDKEEYIKGLLKPYRKVLKKKKEYPKWDYSDPSQWVEFI